MLREKNGPWDRKTLINYQRKIGNDKDIDELLSVYHRIIKRLMNLQEFEEFEKETVTMDELVHNAGLSYLGETK